MAIVHSNTHLDGEGYKRVVQIVTVNCILNGGPLTIDLNMGETLRGLKKRMKRKRKILKPTADSGIINHYSKHLKIIQILN